MAILTVYVPLITLALFQQIEEIARVSELHRKVIYSTKDMFI